jgi:mannose-6-phosphate isomerase-like protein (cupin superfamily)
MDFFVADIRKETLVNTSKGPIVLYRDPSGFMEVAVSSVGVGDNVPEETHETSTQFVRIECGTGNILGRNVKSGDCVVIPAGTPHTIINTNRSNPLKFYTIYSKNKNDKFVH